MLVFYMSALLLYEVEKVFVENGLATSYSGLKQKLIFSKVHHGFV